MTVACTPIVVSTIPDTIRRRGAKTQSAKTREEGRLVIPGGAEPAVPKRPKPSRDETPVDVRGLLGLRPHARGDRGATLGRCALGPPLPTASQGSGPRSCRATWKRPRAWWSRSSMGSSSPASASSARARELPPWEAPGAVLRSARRRARWLAHSRRARASPGQRARHPGSGSRRVAPRASPDGFPRGLSPRERAVLVDGHVRGERARARGALRQPAARARRPVAAVAEPTTERTVDPVERCDERRVRRPSRPTWIQRTPTTHESSPSRRALAGGPLTRGVHRGTLSPGTAGRWLTGV